MACAAAWPAAAVAGIASSFTGTEGTALSGVVVDHISTMSSCGNFSQMTINWGDGSATSSGAAYEAGDGCDITNTTPHTYTEEGSYTTEVSYALPGGGLSEDAGSATIADATLSGSAVNDFTVAAGSPVSGTVADWSDAVAEALSHYTTTIDWGDGTVTAGTITSYTVTGSHTYVNGGRYPITVTVRDDGGSTMTAHEHAYVTGCPTSAPSTPAPAFWPSSNTLNGRWVQAIFHDVLGRSPSNSELTAFTNALSFGATRSQEVMTLLSSTAYRTDVIDSDYQRYLRRSPSGSETSAALSELGSGTGDEELAAQVLGSPSYYSSRGGSSIDGFLGAMYCDAVYRAIDVFDQNNGDYALSMGTMTRAQIAAGVTSSGEYLKDTANGYYLHYLRRVATPTELAAGAYVIDSLSDEQLIADLLAGTEYFDIFNPVVTVATTSIAHGTITTTLNRYASVTLTVLHVIPHLSQDITISKPHTRLVGTVHFGRHRPGRLKLHWNGKVDGRRLSRGSYILLLKAYRGRKLVGVSDALPFKIR
jgi:hypothetical protein